jgi:hypothetical protein
MDGTLWRSDKWQSRSRFQGAYRSSCAIGPKETERDAPDVDLEGMPFGALVTHNEGHDAKDSDMVCVTLLTAAEWRKLAELCDKMALLLSEMAAGLRDGKGNAV